jgi:MYXO-CTERM domain-containing protein
MMRRLLTCAVLLAAFGTPAESHAIVELASGDPATLLDLNDDYASDLADDSNPDDGVTAFAFLPDGRMVITLKTGGIKVRTSDGSIVDAGAFSVDSSSEKGLLNVITHPQFATNNLLIFYYSQSGGDALVDKHRVVTAPFDLATNKVNTGGQVVLLKDLPGPENHDAGGLGVSPDGQFLYVSVGDTGCNVPGAGAGGDPELGSPNNYFGTCLTNPNGKILRIGIDGSIPATNPLVNVAAATACTDRCMTSAPTGTGAPRKEIFAWGFRNPWRFWVDPTNGNLWVADVGGTNFEEVNVVTPAGGKHYGWPFREGTGGQEPTACTGITPNVGECVAPVYSCAHGGDGTGDNGCVSITGGFILGCTWPAAFKDRYVFGDYNGRMSTVQVTADRQGVMAGTRKDLLVGNEVITSIAPGPDGALYYATLKGGIDRVAPKQADVCPPQGGAGGTGGAGGGGAAGTAGATSTGGAAGAASGGTGGVGGATGVAGAASGGKSAVTPGSTTDSGCGCRTAGASGRAIGFGAIVVAGLAAALRRKRRAS